MEEYSIRGNSEQEVNIMGQSFGRSFLSRAQIAEVGNFILGEILPGQAEQDVNEASASQRYKIGARKQKNGRVYHYGMAGGTLNPGMGAFVKDPQTTSQEAITVDAPAGSRQLTLTLDNTDGPTYNGLLPANYLEGGSVVVFAAAGTFRAGILSNTAVTVNTGTAVFTVVLDTPTPVAVVAGDVAEAQCSIYRNMVANTDTKLGSGMSAVVGVPELAATVGQFIWVQTWGLTWVAPHAAVGLAEGENKVVFNGDGSFGQGEEHNSGAKDLGLIGQAAGYVVSRDKGTGQAAPFVMLQLDP